MIFDKLAGRVGLAFSASGIAALFRMTNNHDLVVAQGKGGLAESSVRGQIFTASVAEAGIALGTALSTTAAFSLHNPDGSNKLLSILKVVMGYVSGTVGAGNLVYGKVADAAAPTGGTGITPLCSDFEISSPGQAKAGTGHTVDATPTLYRPSGINLSAFVASSAEMPPLQIDNVDGEITIPEGYTFVIDEKGAGGSSEKVILAVVYQEIPNG